jgi:predicted HD phosphohydrolase
MNDIVAIMRAADFAARKHTKQKRKGEEAEPYLNHLIEVASLVAESIDGRPDVVIAALLHDAVEDQDVTNAEIADLFGQRVAFSCRRSDRRQEPFQNKCARIIRSPARHTRATAPRSSSSPTRQATCSSSLRDRRRGQRIRNGPMSTGRGAVVSGLPFKPAGLMAGFEEAARSATEGIERQG